MGIAKSLLSTLLDEIERLRRVLTRRHGVQCTLIREGESCICGADTREVVSLVELQGLRAQLVQARMLIESSQREITRLDQELLFIKMAKMQTIKMVQLEKPAA